MVIVTSEKSLSKKYGKCALMERELAMEDIPHRKPLIVLELICEKIGLEKKRD